MALNMTSTNGWNQPNQPHQINEQIRAKLIESTNSIDLKHKLAKKPNVPLTFLNSF